MVIIIRHREGYRWIAAADGLLDTVNGNLNGVRTKIGRIVNRNRNQLLAFDIPVQCYIRSITTVVAAITPGLLCLDIHQVIRQGCFIDLCLFIHNKGDELIFLEGILR